MQENNWNQQYQPPYGQQGPERKGFAIASLVLGILSIVLCCMYGGFLFGIPGAILGIVSLVKHENKMGMAIAGIITSYVGIIYGIVLLMTVMMTVRVGMEQFNSEWYQMMEELYGVPRESQGTLPNNDAKLPEEEVTENAQETETHGANEENPFAGNSYVMGDGSVIYLEADGTFIWYQDDAVHEDHYVTGTYDAYRAELAESYLMIYLGVYGKTEEELAERYQGIKKDETYTKEDFICLVLHNESVIAEGKEQAAEPYDTNYMGYYVNESYDAVNMADGAAASFVRR